MASTFLNVKVAVGSDVLKYIDPEQLELDYCALLRQLHGADTECSTTEFAELLAARSELIVFMVNEGCLIAMGQASRIRTPPRHKVMIDNLVVATNHEADDLHKVVIERLLQEADQSWGSETPLVFFINISPTMENADWCRSMGFLPFSEAEGALQTVWERRFG